MRTLARYSLVLAMTAGVFAGGLAQAQEPPAACSPKDSAIYFGNGVLGSRTGAKRALAVVENEVRTLVSPEEFDKIKFDLSYNETDSFGVDLLEATIQDLATDATLFWRILGNTVPMPASFRDRLLELAADIDEAALLTNQDLANHVGSYKNDVLEGRKVILVAHSQGNLFGNLAYGNLTAAERASFGIVSVANPDATVAGGGPYSTLAEDLVILAIRLAKQEVGLPPPLPPNVTNFFTLADLSGHGFVKAYLAPNSNSRAKIFGDIVSVRNSLAPPPNSGGQGIITVTLTWGSQPDVDLHAFEPNGAHVYYAHTVGPSGFLDVDDVTGFGPEHYYVSCSTLETGSYRIGVNYYRGSAPEVANVLVAAGLNTRSYSIFLPAALGSSGDANPMPVGTIVVTGSPEQGYSFDIQ
jgi:hypothetical protein